MDNRLLEVLVCPLCKGTLEYQATQHNAGPELICVHDQLAFPIRDGIPIMLVEQARPLNPTDSSCNTSIAETRNQ